MILYESQFDCPAKEYFASYFNLQSLVVDGKIETPEDREKAKRKQIELSTFLIEECYSKLPQDLKLMEKVREHKRILIALHTLKKHYIYFDTFEIDVANLKKKLRVKTEEDVDRKIKNTESYILSLEYRLNKDKREPQLRDFYNDLKLIAVTFKISPDERMSLALYASFKKDLYAQRDRHKTDI